MGLTPDDPAPSADERIVNAMLQFHADFLLGPANQMLGGGTMLVDTSSQYGVGSIYFLAGWFELVPIGHGTLRLFDGVFTALFFAAGYCAPADGRASSRSARPPPLGVGVVVLVLQPRVPGRDAAPGGAAAVRAADGGRAAGAGGRALAGRRRRPACWRRRRRASRRSGRSRRSRYTVATFAAIVACSTMWLAPAERRRGCLVRATASAALARAWRRTSSWPLATLVAARAAPDWSQYLSLLKAFLAGEPGRRDLRLLALVAGARGGRRVPGRRRRASSPLVRLRPGLARRERVALLALTAVTAYGVVSFSYFVDRSADHVLRLRELPACCWSRRSG